MGRTAPLTSKRYILYIYSTNIGTEYLKHALYSPFFSLQNAVCFIMLTCLVPVLFKFYIQDVLKFKKKIIPATKVELGVHIHVSLDLSSGKEFQYPLNSRVRGPGSRARYYGEEQNILTPFHDSNPGYMEIKSFVISVNDLKDKDY